MAVDLSFTALTSAYWEKSCKTYSSSSHNVSACNHCYSAEGHVHACYIHGIMYIVMTSSCHKDVCNISLNETRILLIFSFFFFRTPLSTSVTISPQKLDPLKEIQLLKQQQEQLQQLQELEKRFKQTSSTSYASPSSSASSSTYNSQTASTTYMSAERTHAGFQDKS